MTIRLQFDNDGLWYLYITQAEGIVVTVDKIGGWKSMPEWFVI